MLNREGIVAPLDSLFGAQGRAFLGEVKLKALGRWEVDEQLAMLDLLQEQNDELDREVILFGEGSLRRSFTTSCALPS